MCLEATPQALIQRIAVELREGDGVYINDKKVQLRGVNRHSFWPDSGRALNRTLSRDDLVLLKSMNVNAVRSSHYPPDRHFLELADSLGMYVLDELAGWQAKYDTPVGRKLVEEMVTFDANHPSIIFWDNGNEWGWNLNLDGDFARWDPQLRPVVHPQDTFRGIAAPHYLSYDATAQRLDGSTVFMPTEFLHGLYDGGAGAGLDDYWALMEASSISAGGFLWAWLDEGVVRTDRDGQIDTRSNQAPDGIVGPYRQKEASYYTIREIWSPVQIDLSRLDRDFDGVIEVENHYDFTDLESVQFSYQLMDFDFSSLEAGGRTVFAGVGRTQSVSPGARGPLELVNLPQDFADHHALRLSAEDADGRIIGEWSWMIPSASEMRQAIVDPTSSEPVNLDQSSESSVVVTAGTLQVTFDKATGMLDRVAREGHEFSLSDGPTLSREQGDPAWDIAPLFVPSPMLRTRWGTAARGLVERMPSFGLAG